MPMTPTRQPPPQTQPPRAPPPRPQDVYDPVPERQPPAGQQPDAQEPPRHPAQPPIARPGRPTPDQQPQVDLPEEEVKPEREVAPEEALQLFRAGHKLKRAGDPPEKWFAASRLFNQLVLCVPVTEEVEKQIAGEQLVLAED